MTVSTFSSHSLVLQYRSKWPTASAHSALIGTCFERSVENNLFKKARCAIHFGGSHKVVNVAVFITQLHLSEKALMRQALCTNDATRTENGLFLNSRPSRTHQVRRSLCLSAGLHSGPGAAALLAPITPLALGIPPPHALLEPWKGSASPASI